MNTTENQTRLPRGIIEALVQQGVDYSVAEDKAFLTKNTEAEFTAHAGLEATVKALAIVMGTDEGHALERILEAQPSD